MATIPRTYLTTSKTGLSSVPLRNGQVISIWDNDEVWYDAPANGERDGNPVRRKISGVRIVSTLPDNPMTDIVYVYIGDHGTLPETGDPIYDLRVWVNNEWLVVGNNWEDSFVKSVVSDGKFYLVGTPDITESVGSLLKNSAVYVEDGKLYGYLEGTAHYATEATHSATADLATQAINDNFSTPQPITSYIRGVTSDATTDLGTTLTLIKGDGTTSSIRVSNTKYGVFTEDPNKPGLVNGINTTVGSDTTDLLLTGSGWVDISNITMPSADSADKDGLGQVIAETYVASASYDTTTDELTLTFGDGATSSPISIPNTEYEVFDSNTNGLVPAPGQGEGTYFLRGDHSWQPVVNTDYTGATSGTAGVHGLVPAAASGNVNSYLRSDGTWAGVFGQDSNGLVPGPSNPDPVYSLRADGTWDICPDTKNTSGATNDTTHKLFITGAQTQGTEPQTYTNEYVFIDSNKLYSYSVTDTAAVEVVTLSDTQALTNKTYNGYTLGTACAGTLANTIYPSTSISTDTYTGDGTTTDFVLTNTAITITNVLVNGAIESNYTYTAGTKTVAFTTAPSNGSTVVIQYSVTNPNYNPDEVPKNSAVISYVSNQINNNVMSKLTSKLDITSVADIYDPVAGTYSQGDFCMYEDVNGVNLYECTDPSGVPTPEQFDYAKWTKTTVMDVIKSL